jgi:hypothetical protein
MTWDRGRVRPHARPAPDHEPAGRFFLNRDLKHRTGEGERAADRQRLVVLPLRVPFLDVEVKAGQSVVLWHWV